MANSQYYFVSFWNKSVSVAAPQRAALTCRAVCKRVDVTQGCQTRFSSRATSGRSSIACRPWIFPILPPPPHSYAGQQSIAAKIFSWTLLAVQKSKCLLCMLITGECHSNKWISNGLLTFCKARHAIEAWRKNNTTFREIGVKRYQRVRKTPLHERPQDWASDSHKEHILHLNLSPLFCVVLQNGLLILRKHCHKLDLCTSSRPSHLHEAHWE